MKKFFLLILFSISRLIFANGGTILGVNVTYVLNGVDEDDFISKTDPFTSIYIDPGTAIKIDVWRDGGISAPYLYSVFNQQTSYYAQYSGGGTNREFNIPSNQAIGRWSAGVDNDFMDFRVYQQIALTTPANGSNQSATSINFGWISSTDVSSHWLQVDDNSDFSSPFFDQDVGNIVLYQKPGFPNDGTVFHWRVRGKYTGQWGPYTATWSFSNGQSVKDGIILGINVTYVKNGVNDEVFINKTDPFTSIYVDPETAIKIDVWRDGGTSSPYLYSVFNQQTSYYDQFSGGGTNHEFDIPSGQEIGRWSAGVDNDFMDFRVYQRSINGLVAYYPFNGNANDESGNGNDGIVIGAMLSEDIDGNPNSAYYFDGIDAKITAPTKNLPTGNADRTISVWVRSDDFGQGNRMIIGWGTPSLLNMSAIAIGHSFSSDKKPFFWGYGADLIAKSELTDNLWNNVLCTYKNDTMKIYLNGNLSDSAKLTLNTTSDSIYIGWYYETLSGFRGSIDEISIYNYALTIEEIKVIVGVEDDYKQATENYLLSQNYPNPFNPSTKISYSLPYRSKVKIDIYNSLGQQIKILVDEEKDAGSYEIEFDGKDLTSGVYIYHLITGEYRETKKMLLLR